MSSALLVGGWQLGTKAEGVAPSPSWWFLQGRQGHVWSRLWVVIMVIVAGEFSICALGFLLDQGLWMEFLGTVGFRGCAEGKAS